jgi:hypothetical protein
MGYKSFFVALYFLALIVYLMTSRRKTSFRDARRKKKHKRRINGKD